MTLIKNVALLIDVIQSSLRQSRALIIHDSYHGSEAIERERDLLLCKA